MARAPGLRELFGTDEPPAERRVLTAGAFSAVFENGNLRTIRHGGVEVLRAISYSARDASWATCPDERSGLSVRQGDGSFDVAYDTVLRGPNGARFVCRMAIHGDAAGILTWTANGIAEADFTTNRTGFTVLHAAEAAGSPVTVTHTDGRTETIVFPRLISPDQPAFDIAALTHAPAPGVSCTVEMLGDAFEMEDQRNWSDASYKTYVRPLAKPRPYVIAKGQTDRQRVVLRVTGAAPSPATGGKDVATLAPGAGIGRMPAIALFLEAQDLASASANRGAIGAAQTVALRFDPVRGGTRAALSEASALARFLNAGLAIQAVFDARDPATEAARLLAEIKASGCAPEALAVIPRRDFNSRPSNTLPTGERPIGEIVAALRQAGCAVPIGGGTPSFFTEFNRNPPDGNCDFIFFAIATNVHVADDESMMENVGTYSAILASAKERVPGKPMWLGPCTISLPHNPYAASVVPNPERLRKADSRDDPRQEALFGAAFMTAAAARAAIPGVERLMLAAPTGSFGLVNPDGRPRPVRAVHDWLARNAGKERLSVDTQAAGIAAIAVGDADGPGLLVANLSAEPIALRLPAGTRSAHVIEADGRVAPRDVASSGRDEIGAYRTVFFG